MIELLYPSLLGFSVSLLIVWLAFNFRIRRTYNKILREQAEISREIEAMRKELVIASGALDLAIKEIEHLENLTTIL